MAETLVVVSKIKKFIKEKAELSTSAGAIDKLSEIVEKECLKAAQKSKRSKQKNCIR